MHHCCRRLDVTSEVRRSWAGLLAFLCPNGSCCWPVLLEHCPPLLPAPRHSANWCRPSVGSIFCPGAVNVLYGIFMTPRTGGMYTLPMLLPTGLGSVICTLCPYLGADSLDEANQPHPSIYSLLHFLGERFIVYGADDWNSRVSYFLALLIILGWKCTGNAGRQICVYTHRNLINSGYHYFLQSSIGYLILQQLRPLGIYDVQFIHTRLITV